MLHLRRFLLSALVFAAAYGGYALAVAPWLEPAPKIVKKAPSVPLDLPLGVGIKRNFDGLFQPGDWELAGPKVVETADCTLLLQDYKPTDDGRMEINPCTLIFYATPKGAPAGSDAQAERSPIVLRAVEGAILQFDRPLDLGRAEFGRLEGGRLVGPIVIYSPPSAPGADDALRINTRNVQIDQQRAWTPNEVEFQYGSSFGRGRDLTIALLPPEKPSAGQSKSPAIGGVRALQLARVEKLHLAVGGEGLLPGTPGAAPKPNAKEPPLEIRCQGPFILDLEQQIAAFDDRVEVSRVHPIGPPDRLLCQTLTLHLSSGQTKDTAANADKAAPQPTPPAGGAAPALDVKNRVERIVAVGNPAILEGAAQGVFARATRMEYVVATRRMVLENGLDANGKPGPEVSLTQWQNEFRARELEYELAEAGRLGRLWAAGPGRLKVVQGEGAKRQTIEATWQKELRIRPHEQNKVISLVDAASINVAPLGKFDADELHLWVIETPQKPGAEPAPKGKRQSSFAIVPDRLLAQGRVVIESPQLHAETDRLEAWFVNQAIEADATGSTATPPPVAAATGPAIAPPLGPVQPAAPPPNASAALPPRQPVAPLPPQQKFSVAGKLVQLQIARDGRRNAVDGLNIRGQARVQEVTTAKPDELPLVIQGEAIELRGGATRNAQIDVNGAPANVSARGLNLSGAAIHLHRGENRLWIDGPGKATLPLPPPRNALQPPPPPETVNVTWSGHMTFDGLTAHLERDVVARGKTGYALSDVLDVTLAKRVDFTKSAGGATTEVALLTFRGDTLPGSNSLVHIENVGVDEFGQQVSLDKIEVPNLTIDRQSGTLRANGAGWVSTVRKGGGGLALAPNSAENQPAQSNPLEIPKLTYLNIKFREGIVGDMNKHEVQFRRDVAAIYGQVNTWTDTISARRLEDLGENGAFMTTDVLTVLEMVNRSSPKRWIELDARGNTLVEAQQFTARAQRISYSTEKELLVIEGEGHNDAEFWKPQGTLGSPFGYLASQKFLYFRKTGELTFEGTKVIDFQQLNGTGGKPKPTRWR